MEKDIELSSNRIKQGLIIKNLRQEIQGLVHNIEKSYIRLGALLVNVYRDKTFLKWKYDSFAQYCTEELGFKERKAWYWMAIWKQFKQELKIPDTQLEKVGWTKASKLLPVINKDNATDWLTKAETSSVSQLVEQVNQSKRGQEVAVIEHSERMVFHLFASQTELVQQALRKAGKEGNSDKQGRQLELICIHYLSDPNLSKEVSLHWVLKKIEEIYECKLEVKDE